MGTVLNISASVVSPVSVLRTLSRSLRPESLAGVLGRPQVRIRDHPIQRWFGRDARGQENGHSA